MAAFYVRSAGVWQRVNKFFVKTGGAWVEIRNAYVKQAGVWQKFFSNSGVLNPLPVTSIGDNELSPANGLASLTIVTNGTITVSGNGSVAGPNWYNPTTAGIGNTHWVTLDKLSGDSPTSGDSIGVILALTVNRSWTWAQNVVGLRSGSYQLRIWGDAAATILLGLVNFNVNVQKDA